MSQPISFAIKFSMHMLVLYGCWLLLQPLLEKWIKGTGHHVRVAVSHKFKALGKRIDREKKSNPLVLHIDQLLYLTSNDYVPRASAVRFIVSIVLLFISAFIIAMILIGEVPNSLSFDNPFEEGITADHVEGKIIWQYPFLSALFVAAVPYIILRYNYSVKSVQSTYDLLDVIKILSKYADLSIDSALQRTAKSLSENNVLKRPLRGLSLVFSNYASENELQQEMNRFSSVIGSTFAIDLSMNLLYLQKQGSVYLKEYLIGLYREMEEQRLTIIKVKEGTRDAISLGTYGNLLVFVLCVVSLILILGPHVYLKLQFQSQVGLTFFFIIIASFIVSVIIAAVLARPRLDYY